MDNAERLFAAGKAFYMCACRGDDYTPGYFSPNRQNWLDLIRASSAIPGSTAQGCAGRRELPGWGRQRRHSRAGSGEAGAKTLVVIRTVPSQMYYTPQWFKRMERWLGESSLQPLLNLVQHHEATYRAIQSFIEKPPGKLRIFEIYPPKPLHSMALGSRIPALAGRLQNRTPVRSLLPRYRRQTAGEKRAAASSDAEDCGAGTGGGSSRAGGQRCPRAGGGQCASGQRYNV
jgi:predicted patatin/cPLA2 family phospholipase